MTTNRKDDGGDGLRPPRQNDSVIASTPVRVEFFEDRAGRLIVTGAGSTVTQLDTEEALRFVRSGLASDPFLHALGNALGYEPHKAAIVVVRSYRYSGEQPGMPDAEDSKP